MQDGLKVLSAALAEALDLRKCVSAWLGQGNVLFLGTGITVLAERDADGRRLTPPYELQSNHAEWTIESATRKVVVHQDHEDAEAAARALVGRPVIGWKLAGRHALRIKFHGGPLLTIRPMTDAALTGQSAWWVCLPGGRTVTVTCDARVVATDSRRDTCDWLKRAGE
jgi:hypothetical protein